MNRPVSASVKAGISTGVDAGTGLGHPGVEFGTYSAGAVAQGHHAVLLSMTRSRTSTTVSPPALSRRLTANGLSTLAR